MAKYQRFNLPDELYYHPEDHLWARLEGDLVRIGLDDLAQSSAQAISHVRFKPAGRPTPQNRPFGTMEAGKYVGLLRLPVGGKVIEANEALLSDAGLANRDPYGEGWMVLVEPDNLANDLTLLVHGDGLQAWLEQSVADWREKGLLK
jgi:glycine cleavage system H protein